MAPTNITSETLTKHRIAFESDFDFGTVNHASEFKRRYTELKDEFDQQGLDLFTQLQGPGKQCIPCLLDADERVGPVILNELAESPWQLNVLRLTDSFGPTVLKSRNFVKALRELVKAEAELVDWTTAYNRLLVSKAERQEQGRQGQSKQRDWSPADLTGILPQSRKQALDKNNVTMQPSKKRKRTLNKTPEVRKATRLSKMNDESRNQKVVEQKEADEAEPSYDDSGRSDPSEDDGDSGDQDGDDDDRDDSVIDDEYCSPEIGRHAKAEGEAGASMNFGHSHIQIPSFVSPSQLRALVPAPAPAQSHKPVSIGIRDTILHKAEMETCVVGPALPPSPDSMTTSQQHPQRDSPLSLSCSPSSKLTDKTNTNTNTTSKPWFRPLHAPQRLNDIVIQNILATFLLPHVHLIWVQPPDDDGSWPDWPASRPKPYTVPTHKTLVIVPLHRPTIEHWVLMSFDLLTNCATYLDSHGPSRMSAAQAGIVARALVSSFADCDWYTQRWVCHMPPSASQPNQVDCGVFAMINAIAIMARFPVPASLDAELWRIILLHACGDASIPVGRIVPRPPTDPAGTKHHSRLCDAALYQANLAIHILDHYYTEIALALSLKAEERIDLDNDVERISCALQALRKVTVRSTRLSAADRLMNEDILQATKKTERIIKEHGDLEVKASFVKVARQAAKATTLLLDKAIAAASTDMRKLRDQKSLEKERILLQRAACDAQLENLEDSDGE
mgnify:CR=1 FL=1